MLVCHINFNRLIIIEHYQSIIHKLLFQDTSEFSRDLLHVTLNVITEEKCIQFDSQMTSDFICTYTPDKTTQGVSLIAQPHQENLHLIRKLIKYISFHVQGDSGSPLVSGGYQIGIVSYGNDQFSHDSKSFLSSFIRVYPHVDWIVEHSGSQLKYIFVCRRAS